MHVDIMRDGDTIGYKVVFRTGEVTLMTDEEIEKAIKNRDKFNEEFDKHKVVVSEGNGIGLGRADLPDDIFGDQSE